MHVTLDTLTFDGTPDADGIRWRLEWLEGWDSPAVRFNETPTPLQDGTSLGVIRYGSRSLVLRGTAEGTTIEHLHLAAQRLSALAALTRTDGILSVDETPPKFCTVRLGDRIRTRRHGGYSITFELPLVAADPRKYSTALYTTTFTVNAGGTVAAPQMINNAGTFSSPPVWARIAGGIPSNGWSLSGLGIATTPWPTAADTMVATWVPRALTVNGAHQSGLIDFSTTSWSELAPGDTAVNFITYATDAYARTLELRWRDAWI